jgi:hypothetical protein
MKRGESRVTEMSGAEPEKGEATVMPGERSGSGKARRTMTVGARQKTRELRWLRWTVP